MSITFFILAIFVDALMYGYFYQYQIKGHINPVGIFKKNNSFWLGLFQKYRTNIKWLFQEYSVVITKENAGVLLDHHNVFRYRVIVQFTLDAIFLTCLYFFGYGIETNTFFVIDWITLHLEFCCTLLGIFFVVKEFGYYLILDQLQLVKSFEADPYWLNRLYFITGYYKFSYTKFRNSFIIGCIIISIPYFIKLISILQ